MVNGLHSFIYSELVNCSSPLGYHDCLVHCLEASSLIGFCNSPCVVSSLVAVLHVSITVMSLEMFSMLKPLSLLARERTHVQA